ncbi:hypothetical protein [Mycobacterium sp. OTB74]|jgi:hypothetical protein|uniref:hypothetical protein n=1 Tax=Mycobacterium sp. OTB74 TaxID=1853452 RepID=UPI0024738B14|nr:hypothetical protein [Mycobacterium sp. OTB74]MDH6243391.1 hypothetical protein [Mycobacterium sp. OTB74]
MSYRETTTVRRSLGRSSVTLAALLLIAGCSGHKTATQPTSTPSDTAGQSAAAAPNLPPGVTPPAGPPSGPSDSGQLDGGTCLQLTGAVVNLVSGATGDDTAKAADTIKGFNPPQDVLAAVAHFVGTNGLHTDDPDRNQYSRAINNWVEKKCPV